MNAYRAAATGEPVPLQGQWNAAPWRGVRPEALKYHMGDRPTHFPRTCFKVAYDDQAIRVIFRVKDRYIRAACTKNQGPVWKDSCVEFFFTPGPDIRYGYFNMEMNCCGVFLFNFQKVPRRNIVVMPPEACRRVRRWHSVEGPVIREIRRQVTWIVEYSIPFDVLGAYCHVEKPCPGINWRANFYKIASGTSHPHHLTWSPVINPYPDFHKPQYFGILEFA